MEIILIIVAVIAIIIAYIIGRVQGIPDYYPCTQSCNHNYPYSVCQCSKCCPWDYVSRTEARINADAAYQKGKFDSYQEHANDIRYTRFMSLSEKEKFLTRFNECIKPIEEMKKDLESGKF